MILLDTNVVSEPLRLSGHPAVVAWIDEQNVETLYLAAISLAELRFGVAALSNGKRKDTLHRNLERSVVPLFTGRILPFDAAASEAYAEIMARAKSEGKAIGKADGYIAAIAAANGLIVATRDISPFEAAGLTVINPWKG
ncbi:PIN domain-containing protein [Photorhabdus laumondii subsp. laumondii]|uniref:Ribonuclease VapC n=2 Tax=Photorhabdus laumondii subsp. laumondii TaxID=141679 RepID=Q7N2L9_PHOLL|nr:MULTISPECIES: type II toxin-antitoxin system VapC family toxin [Photorhabdus]AWK42758.1 plasmid stability protein StbB [Photorhabdus laumondii subsp. laumondii]AXG43532.1 PIN domain-containing protein [Photorhabdus laumondii subsp. laumondii]AXG48076.1 PIN domain-containing protein [Photorhabdus laumondii subsp. laumondii]KTL62599.1 plasmid stability protein StbB [Photorhabdus laumondii subsp. laumondii]MCC8382600.1 type II toxin-antitoxin system VapC family toxin [Photorhabdus laumondii]